MNHLNPGETFAINRVLADPNDTATHYVQAIVYDAKTRATLSTINLTDNGSRWFSGTFKVPYDNVYAQGRFIIIITSVYDDSGYTTFSPGYTQQTDEYLVQQRFDLRYLPAGGGVEAKELRTILGDELGKQKFPDPPKITFPAPIDNTPHFDGIRSDIARVEQRVANIPPPIVPEQVDLSPVHARIDELHRKIDALPKLSREDLMPLVEELKAFRKSQEDMHAQSLETMDKAFSEAKLKMTIDHAVSITSPADKRDSHLGALAKKYKV